MGAGSVQVVAVVRHREAVLVCGGTDTDTPGPSLPAAPAGDDPEAALRDLLDGLGVEVERVERRGDPVDRGAARLEPFLVTAMGRTVADGTVCQDPTWTSPTTLLREGGDRWWAAYAAVAPTVETVAADRERGSTAVAVDALWTLRDAAAAAGHRGDGMAPVEAVAGSLLDARPSMAALGNRVNRAMAGAETPGDVAAVAEAGIVDAHEADAAAAALAAETVDGGRVLTFSRSGTVRAALLQARPAVVVLASRPGGEGLVVADELAVAGLTVEVCPDADVYDRLRAGDVDAVLVGADAVTADGWVVNKVGTRAAALAAEAAGVPCYVACASDKVRPASGDGGPVWPPLEPVFDLTPPRLVTSVLTERGRLSTDDVVAIAAEHRELARWRTSA